jgi:hypothetical protein
VAAQQLVATSLPSRAALSWEDHARTGASHELAQGRKLDLMLTSPERLLLISIDQRGRA